MSIETISKAQARRLWIEAQKLDEREPFGAGPAAARAAIEHLGYVQIDTINVVERCHHHILFSRIPRYRREDLHHVQSRDKSVFEYWTHALSYVPVRDFRFFVSDMRTFRREPGQWFAPVTGEALRRVLRLVRSQGALSTRDIEDEVLVEKSHAWASRKPSKKALELAFFRGELTVAERLGIVKKYELTGRHFGWDRLPAAARESEYLDYILDRALRSQAVVSLDSICHLDAGRKPAVRKRIEARVRGRELIAVQVEDLKTPHWMRPELLARRHERETGLTHILSPFDPLIIQRKRLKALFDYDHVFEAYVPKEKRRFGYFTQPVLVDDRIVASLDLKADREKHRLLVQKWNWHGKAKAPALKRRIEEELGRFERFQLPSRD